MRAEAGNSEAQHDEQALREKIIAVVREAKEASHRVALATTQEKNAALAAMAEALRANRACILEANRLDVEEAKKSGLSSALADRLLLNGKRFKEMVDSVEAVRELSDPVGATIRSWNLKNGLAIRKVRVPLGVVGIIYESRPNVTSDCSTLCLKSGNAAVLRGGSESFRSNQAIGGVLKEALRSSSLPEAAISTIPTAERFGVDVMLRRNEEIDVIIPRGSEGLIRRIAGISRIPVIKHAKGVCHVYVDAAADLDMAEAIAVNSKCQRPSTCNAMETLLVHKAVAAAFVPRIVKRLQDSGVEVRGDEQACSLVKGIKSASEEDWCAEYLDLILSLKVVGSVDEAIEHISRYGSGHSDAIVTADEQARDRFLRQVDSAAVYVNASTRFTDGSQFGFGAEIGISTDRLHARGPMGLEELTTYKYVVVGDGQIRA